jgi:hypothetical protein
LIARFETETFGFRAGSLLEQGDTALENDLSLCDVRHLRFRKRSVDALERKGILHGSGPAPPSCPESPSRPNRAAGLTPAVAGPATRGSDS